MCSIVAVDGKGANMPRPRKYNFYDLQTTGNILVTSVFKTTEVTVDRGGAGPK